MNIVMIRGTVSTAGTDTGNGIERAADLRLDILQNVVEAEGLDGRKVRLGRHLAGDFFPNGRHAISMAMAMFGWGRAGVGPHDDGMSSAVGGRSGAAGP